MNEYNPPFTLTYKILSLHSDIIRILERLTIKDTMIPKLQLRKVNRVKTIQSSLAIEANTLTVDQVSAILNGKRVLGFPKEIKEVENAIKAYDILLDLNPYSLDDMLKAHRLLMNELLNDAGCFRSQGVGVYSNGQLIHMAPPATFVPELMSQLITWVKETDLHPLIKSCVFHYEFEFIHPFANGNGRMGRMWQTLLLYQYEPVFAYLPVETLIKQRQSEYYEAINQSSANTDCAVFIEFMLETILETLKDYEAEQDIVQESVQDYYVVTVQVERLLNAIGNETLSTKELMSRLHMKHRPTFRNNYLLPALDLGLIEMTIPDKPTSGNQRYRKVRK